MSAQPRIVILTADTGGGHRSVAEALVEAFHEVGQPNTDVVDVFEYVPWPFSRMPNYYRPTIEHAARLWKFIYAFFGGRTRGGFSLRSAVYPLTRNGLRRLYREHRPELVISTHPIFQYNAARILRQRAKTVPFVSMVTDLASAHRWWFTRLSDLCLIPSEELRTLAMQYGIATDKIHVTGLPVHRAFSMNRYLTRQEARATLGIEERPTLLLVGGGEGMGALDILAAAADQAQPGLQKLIVSGRNHRLKDKLDRYPWQAPTHVFGFVHNMAQLMRAADLIVTKAGPSTLSEALVCGLPILLSGFVPGQEEGNVRFVLDHKLGYFLRRPADELSPTLDRLLGDGSTQLTAMAQRAYALGRPDAARDAVQLILRIGLPSEHGVS